MMVGYGISVKDFYQHVRFPIVDGCYLRGEMQNYLPRDLAGLFIPVGLKRAEFIIVFPTPHDRSKWYPRGNYAISARTVFLDNPIDPYLVYMDRNGIEVESPRGDPAIIPGIPRIMREWLTRYGVFSLLGISKFRPMAMEW